MTRSASSSTGAGQVYRRPGGRIIDHLWVWGNPELSLEQTCCDGHFGGASPLSRANLLGLRNLTMCGHGIPQDRIYAEAVMRPVAHMDRIVWEIMPDDEDEGFDFTRRLQRVEDLLGQHDNIEGVIIDDMSTVYRERGFDPASLRAVHERMPTAPDGWRLRLYGVIYTMSLRDDRVEQFIEPLDVINLWTWSAEDTAEWDANVRRVQSLGPGKPVVLGLYLTNYGGKAAFTVDTMRAQCESALEMLRSGRIFGINFLLHGAENAEVVAWTRGWIGEVGGEEVRG